MNSIQKFDYYYGREAEQFSFFRIPKLLVKDERFKDLSTDAKFLYGLMLDRMSLSMENGWLDKYNRVYIYYTIENIMSDLNCGKDKCVKILAELDDKKGIGLIQRVKQGLGRPDIIYVMDFVSIECIEQSDKVSEENTVEKVEDNCTNSRLLESRTQDFGKTELKTSEKPNTGLRENRTQGFGKTTPNKTKISDTELSETNPSYLSHESDVMDAMEVAETISFLKDSLEYNIIMPRLSEHERKLYQELFDLVCDIVCVKRNSIKIGGEVYPYELVKARFMKLEYPHLKYVMECMKKTTSKINNIKAYMVTALYNAPDTMTHYYQQAVQHDMFGGGWQEKGIVN